MCSYVRNMANLTDFLRFFFNPLLMFVFLMTEFDTVLLDFTTQAVRIQITLKMAVFRKTDVKHLE